MTKVLVVEEARTFRTALEIAIDVQPDLDCVGAVPTVEEAIAVAATDPPDVVVMDVHLPDVDGIEGTQQLKERHPDARVVILTADPRPHVLKAATDAGAEEFLAKQTVAFPDVLAAIRSGRPETVRGAAAQRPPNLGQANRLRRRQALELRRRGAARRADAEAIRKEADKERARLANRRASWAYQRTQHAEQRQRATAEREQYTDIDDRAPAGLRDDPADMRERLADQRDQDADERDRLADQRQRAADQRDRDADRRDREADLRDGIADDRESVAARKRMHHNSERQS